MHVQQRFNVQTRGRGKQPMLFAHGYGCDQSMWRLVTPAFEAEYRVILFDLAGCGHAHPDAYDRTRHASLQGYAQDVLDIVRELDLRRVVFVGHSVSAMLGVLAILERPELFERLIMVGPSPRYMNDGEYLGGFTREDITGLIDALDSNYLGWASSLAATVMGTPDRPDLENELRNSFCRMRPDIARAFARLTFFGDNRADLPRVNTPSLVLQVTHDLIAPTAVGRYVQANMPHAELTLLPTRGHCPHLSAPALTIEATQRFLARTRHDGR